VVLMIGLGEGPDIGDTGASGICASLSKPIHRQDLAACLRVALGSQIVEVTPAEATIQRPAPSSEPQSGDLLLAEDNPINQKVAVAMLSSVGYRVDTVVDGAAAVHAAAARPYDAILMDCQMPELSGYEATAAIRGHEGPRRHTPIIAMTAGARREDRERCLASGMDGYLSKPVTKDALLALVARYVRPNRATPGRPPHPGTDTATEALFDPVVLDQLRVLGEAAEEDFLGELITQFVQDTGPLLAQLREAVDTDNAFAVSGIAHRIRGSAGQLGGRRLVSSCSRLEHEATTDLSSSQIHLREVETDYQDLRRILTQHVLTTAPHR
jgi:CheY-like chemotaxis protein/HPt (histidine-containing phosphotransfer) domain-containing protein